MGCIRNGGPFCVASCAQYRPPSFGKLRHATTSALSRFSLPSAVSLLNFAFRAEVVCFLNRRVLFACIQLTNACNLRKLYSRLTHSHVSMFVVSKPVATILILISELLCVKSLGD